MNRILLSFVLFIVLMYSQKANAQAYDGKGDTKIFLGYANTKGYSGIQFKLEAGLSNLISAGGTWTYYFINGDSITDNGTDDAFSEIMDKSEIEIFMNFHLNKPLHLGDKSDVYVGAYTSLKSTGIQAGYKYNFSERFGLYAELSQGLFNVFDLNSETSTGSSAYEKRTLISAGLTFNFLR
jgi:hypothetical protein